MRSLIFGRRSLRDLLFPSSHLTSLGKLGYRLLNLFAILACETTTWQPYLAKLN
jgi:hypothetical protein